MKFEDLVSKVLNDAQFRDAVEKDPEKALRDAGVEPTPEKVATLKKVDMDAMKEVAKAFGTSSVECAC